MYERRKLVLAGFWGRCATQNRGDEWLDAQIYEVADFGQSWESRVVFFVSSGSIGRMRGEKIKEKAYYIVLMAIE